MTAAAAKSLQSCPTLCDPMDGSPPGSPVPGILQARTLDWVAISFSNAWKWKVKGMSLSRVRLLATPWTCLPGSSIHGIFQARVLAWDAIVFSKLLTNGGQIWATLFSFIWMSTRYIGCALDVFLLITFTDQVLSHFKHEVKWSESHSVMSDSILTHRILW